MIYELKRKMFEALRCHEIQKAYEYKREYERLEILREVIKKENQAINN